MIQTLTFILHEAGFKNVSSTIFSFSFQLVCFIVSVCCRSCKSTKKNENQGSRRVKRSLSLAEVKGSKRELAFVNRARKSDVTAGHEII